MIADWIRRYRVRWLERKADELEREFAGTAFECSMKAEADRMRHKARMLR